ncbi:MAG: hypothetical protein ABI809_11600 [Caldimonas sp.]
MTRCGAVVVLAALAGAGPPALAQQRVEFASLDRTAAAPVQLVGHWFAASGVQPGQGVHVGGDADALRRSREHLAEFLARH